MSIAARNRLMRAGTLVAITLGLLMPSCASRAQEVSNQCEYLAARLASRMDLAFVGKGNPATFIIFDHSLMRLNVRCDSRREELWISAKAAYPPMPFFDMLGTAGAAMTDDPPRTLARTASLCIASPHGADGFKEKSRRGLKAGIYCTGKPAEPPSFILFFK